MRLHGEKRALLISPSFFGYERDIASELALQGVVTEFIDERPSNSALIRAVLRVRRGLVKNRIEKHYRKMLSQSSGKQFDLVIVIKGEVVPRWFLQAVRDQNPGASFIFYAFDALENSPNCLALVDLFDDLVSFDREDVERHTGFRYLPLFYTEQFRPLSADSAKRHRLAFVGTLHSGRYAFVNRLFGSDGRDYGFFYVQARWYFALTKYLTRENSAVSWKDVSFSSLTRDRIAEIFRESAAVLDMQRTGQSGLTMRTFEVLASGSILVTTNSAIEREPFYDPERVIILPAEVDGAAAQRLRDRLDRRKAEPGTPDGFEAYSLESFVRNLVNVGR